METRMKFISIFWSDKWAQIFLKLSVMYFTTQIRKLSNIKTNYSTTRMQILRHMTDLWAEVVGITITWAGRFCLLA